MCRSNVEAETQENRHFETKKKDENFSHVASPMWIFLITWNTFQDLVRHTGEHCLLFNFEQELNCHVSVEEDPQ